jgi:hypothetical protein
MPGTVLLVPAARRKNAAAANEECPPAKRDARLEPLVAFCGFLFKLLVFTYAMFYPQYWQRAAVVLGWLSALVPP